MVLKHSKHIPQRRCVSCRKSSSKSELLRFFKNASGNWQFDPKQRLQGRGAWICKSLDCYQEKNVIKFFGRENNKIIQAIKLNTNFQEFNIPVKGG